MRLLPIGSRGLAAFLHETIADRMDLSQVEPGFVDWFIAESALYVAPEMVTGKTKPVEPLVPR